MPTRSFHAHPNMERAMVGIVWANDQRGIVSLRPISVMNDRANWKGFTEGFLGPYPM
jgi:hypothetical protein